MSAQRADRKSGRVSFDDDGRSIWEWQVSTGVFTRTVTEEQMTHLANTNLELADAPPARTVTAQTTQGAWMYQSDRLRQNSATNTARPGVATPRASTHRGGPVRWLLRRFAGAV
jgi:hypothetical protein